MRISRPLLFLIIRPSQLLIKSLSKNLGLFASISSKCYILFGVKMDNAGLKFNLMMSIDEVW